MEEKKFKVVKGGKDQPPQQPKVDFSDLTDKAGLEKIRAELQAQGIKVQQFLQQGAKDLPYGEKRLYGELFNVYASGCDCLTALLSIKK